MIGKLTGTIEDIYSDHLLLSTGGVGYLIYCTAPTLHVLSSEHTSQSLFIEMIVREESLTLYGFLTALEKEWFKLLQTVQGVGARVALGLLSAFSPFTLYTLLIQEDKKSLSTCEGIGPKLAIRLVTELKEKLLKNPRFSNENVPSSASMQNIITPSPSSLSPTQNSSSIDQDVLLALEHLGYKRGNALDALSKVRIHSSSDSLEEVLKKTLAHLSLS